MQTDADEKAWGDSHLHTVFEVEHNITEWEDSWLKWVLHLRKVYTVRSKSL